MADTLGWVLYKRGIPSAAIGYLKEAEAGHATRTTPASASCATTWRMAYEANGDFAQAREALSRALAGLEKQLAAARAKGATVAEPPWAADARAMLDRLKAKV